MYLGALRRQLLLQYLLTVGLLLAVASATCYGLVRWAGGRELDAALGKMIEKLEAAVELERYRPHLDGLRALKEAHGPDQTDVWEVLLEDGTILEQSQNAGEETLPALDGADLAVGDLRRADHQDSKGLWVRAARKRVVRTRLERGPPPKPPPRFKLWSSLGWGPAPSANPRPKLMPEQMTFDLRAAVDRTALDERLRWLAWGLAGSFPVLLSLAAVGGIYLIRRAVQPVERAFDRERRFTGAASHELRTPLTALRAEIEVTLRRERAPREYAAALWRMQELVERMTGLVEGLLILARARAGHLLLGAAEVSTESLRTAVADTLRLLPGQERVQLSSSPPDETRMRGDPLLLALAVRNLVENALIHASGSPVQVAITAAVAGVQVAVRDAGAGIPAEILGQHPGAGPDPAAAGRGKRGSGLGLSIARAVVEAHGGRLSLENQAGAGCLAVISLPAISGG